MSGSRTRFGSGSSERELVFCHQCQNEWYTVETDGLQCPECDSDFTEVIDPDFDPRAEAPEQGAFDAHNPWAADPDEDDIDEFGGNFGQRLNANSTPNEASRRSPSYLGTPRIAYGRPPDTLPPLVGSFANMLQGMTGGHGMQFGFPGAGTPMQPDFGPRSRSVPGSPPRQSGPRVNVYTTSGPGFSFTAHSTSRTISTGGTRISGEQLNPQDVNAIMEGIFRNMGFPAIPTGEGSRGNPLATLFSTLLNPANAAHGDAVFSQEAFDRVMSQLMEEHVSGNAPGPASEAAINALPRRKITESMLDETSRKAECSICMEDVNIGEEVAYLPCGHWFHFPCVEAWLREHDTCPVCRAGIMPKEGDRDTIRTPAQAPLHDEDPAHIARRESGSRDHPFVVPESPTRERRRPNPRRHSSGEATTSSSSPTQSGNRGDDSRGITGRMRSFFGGGGGVSGRR